MRIIFDDGSERTVDAGATALDVAKTLSQRLAKETLLASVDGALTDAALPLPDGCKLRLLTFEDEGGRDALRHTASHVLAQAVKRLYPDAKLAIGPAIENGYYYDFDVETPFSPEMLAAIEKEMAKISQENLALSRFTLPRDEAIQFACDMGEPYKAELIRDLPEDSVISFYKQGEFTDLCAGPHVPSTGAVKHFKLMSVAGAYWRGDEHNKMLQRIYGTVFDKKAALEAYLTRIEEAKKRDHRKLGKELDLFSLHDEGPGFPFFHPKCMVIRNALEDFWRKEHRARGYEEIRTPIILNRELWIQSGHWDHYQENMYFTKIDEADYAVKPMNCPGAMLTYKRRNWSYRDLPLRLAELGLVHRHELSGALHGLMRVRCFTQDDAHLFMEKHHIESEIFGLLDKFSHFYQTFGFNFRIELSTRPEKAMGSDEDWEAATNALRSALTNKGVDFVVNEGDGAFYGPKIDFHLEDAIGRTWQCGTIQLDFQMPERFDLTYVGADGEKHRPVMIHTVVFGSIERFIGILIEHCAGAFPAWVAPVQVRLLPITDRANERVAELQRQLLALGVRAETDMRNEKIGFKIREAQMEKIPYMLVVGDKEVESGAVAVRSRKDGDLGVCAFEAFVEKLLEEIKSKAY